MNRGIIARLLGALIAGLALAALAPLGLALRHGEPMWPWLCTIATALCLGGGLRLLGRRARGDQLGIREGMAITTLAWLLGSAVAGFAILLAVSAGTGAPGPGVPAASAPSASDPATRMTFWAGWTEAMSGLTTTGMTVFGGPELPAVEALPRSVLLWRAVLQLLGGVGIVVMALALLPLVAGSGFALYRAEVTGLSADRLAPRLGDTARILLFLNLGLITITTLALLGCGCSLFDSFCHASSGISTGGFSTRNNSVSGLQSAAAEWVLIAAMLTGGMNFALLIAALRGRVDRLWASQEVRLYLAFVVAASAICVVALATRLPSAYAGEIHALIRHSVFTVVSTITSTGYATGFDAVPQGHDGWPDLARGTLIALMLFGACAGSTAGGAKLIRLIVLWKVCRRELRRAGEPARVTLIHLDGRPLPDAVALRVAGFLGLFAFSWLVGLLALCACGMSPERSGVVALQCLSNIGYATGPFGPAGNFGSLSAPEHVLCTLLMLLGRLEFFAVITTCLPKTWRG